MNAYQTFAERLHGWGFNVNALRKGAKGSLNLWKGLQTRAPNLNGKFAEVVKMAADFAGVKLEVADSDPVLFAGSGGSGSPTATDGRRCKP